MFKATLAWRVSCNCMRELFSNYRPYVVGLFSLILAHMASADARTLCSQYGVKATALPLFVHMLDQPYFTIAFTSLWLILICDLPTMNDNQPYVILRCGRFVWMGGVLLYILLMALIYVAWLFATTLIMLMGHVEFSGEWGQVYYSLARIEPISYMMTYSQLVQEIYTAWQAFLLAFVLQWFLSVLFGEMVCVINLATGKMVGLLLPIAFLMLFFRYAATAHPYSWLWFSPVWLSRVSWMAVLNTPQLPPLSYALSFFSIGIPLFAAICMLLMYRRTISIRHPV